MRNVITWLVVTCVLCFSGAARAQVNYDLFPGHGGKVGYPPIVNYHAWVLSYRDSKFYSCVASYEYNTPATPKLVCRPGGSFDPPLLSGANVKTVQALGSPNASDDEAQSSFYWQIDQATGQIQFCMPGPKINCVGFQIP
jgi:hypothetical protein